VNDHYPHHYFVVGVDDVEQHDLLLFAELNQNLIFVIVVVA
jgi:hypothetical protein